MTTTGAQRQPLSRDSVMAAAIQIADEDGVAGLSMRKLARHLGYEVMSLYNHVDGKDDILDGMLDAVVAEMGDPTPGLGWKAGVREIAMSAHEVLVHHPWASALWPTRWPGPHRWAYMETLLRLLATADLSDHIADLGFHAVTMHIQGFTQQQITYAGQAPEEATLFARFHDEITPDRFPHMVAHVRYHQEHEHDLDEFGFVLDLILDGLERLAGRG